MLSFSSSTNCWRRWNGNFENWCFKKNQNAHVWYNASISRKMAFLFAFSLFWWTSICNVKFLVTWPNQESWDSFSYNCSLHQCSCVCMFKSLCLSFYMVWEEIRGFLFWFFACISLVPGWAWGVWQFMFRFFEGAEGLLVCGVIWLVGLFLRSLLFSLTDSCGKFQLNWKKILTIAVIKNEDMFPYFAAFYIIMEVYQAVHREYKLWPEIMRG